MGGRAGVRAGADYTDNALINVSARAATPPADPESPAPRTPRAAIGARATAPGHGPTAFPRPAIRRAAWVSAQPAARPMAAVPPLRSAPARPPAAARLPCSPPAHGCQPPLGSCSGPAEPIAPKVRLARGRPPPRAATPPADPESPAPDERLISAQRLGRAQPAPAGTWTMDVARRERSPFARPAIAPVGRARA